MQRFTPADHYHTKIDIGTIRSIVVPDTPHHPGACLSKDASAFAYGVDRLALPALAAAKSCAADPGAIKTSGRTGNLTEIPLAGT